MRRQAVYKNKHNTNKVRRQSRASHNQQPQSVRISTAGDSNTHTHRDGVKPAHRRYSGTLAQTNKQTCPTWCDKGVDYSWAVGAAAVSDGQWLVASGVQVHGDWTGQSRNTESEIQHPLPVKITKFISSNHNKRRNNWAAEHVVADTHRPTANIHQKKNKKKSNNNEFLNIPQVWKFYVLCIFEEFISNLHEFTICLKN